MARIGMLTVVGHRAPPHAPAMFAITEAEAAEIRAVFEQRGELSAAIELRRRFPGITDNAQALECARTIAGWKTPERPRPVRLPPALRKTMTLRASRYRALSHAWTCHPHAAQDDRVCI